MQALSKLLTLNKGKIYVFLSDETTGNAFLKNIEAEDFTFADGIKPTGRHWDNIIAINTDKTISYVGFIGRIAFQCGKNTGKDQFIKINYHELLNQ